MLTLSCFLLSATSLTEGVKMTLSNCLKFGLSDAKLYLYPDFIQIMVCLLQVNIDVQLTNNMHSRVMLKMSPSYISIH